MHFLCLEPRETDKSVLKFSKKFGPEISLLAAGSPVLSMNLKCAKYIVNLMVTLLKGKVAIWWKFALHECFF